MKKPISHELVKRKLFIALLFSFIAFAGNAQWTYTTTVKQTGRCIPYPTMGPVPFYTKSACEASRQYDLSNSGTDWSVGDGNCTTIITCTPCTGSDISTPGQGGTSGQVSIPGQVNPGDVSINYNLEGKPIFTPHQSQAFEDWASEYKQLLASYGITSILGKNFTIPKVPLTDDKYVNALYTNLSANFNPKTAATIQKTNDLSGKSDISGKKVQILNTPEANKTIRVKPVPPLIPGEIKEDTKHENIDFTRESLVTLTGLAPRPFSYLGIAIVDIYAANAKQLMDCLDGNCKPTSTVLINMASQFATDAAVQGVGDIAGVASGKLFSSLALKNGNILKGADLGFSEFRKGIAEEVIPKMGEGHFGLVSGVTDLVRKWVNAAGVKTIYDDSIEK